MTSSSLRHLALPLLFFSLYTAGAQGVSHTQQTLDTTIVNQYQFIALIKGVKTPENNTYFETIINFKGRNLSFLHSSDSQISIEAGENYLVFANLEEGSETLIAPNYRVTKQMDSQKDINFLYSYLSCRDNLLKKKLENSVCNRMYAPVCGCDNITYGNECAAAKEGIVIYKAGACDKK